MVICTLIFNKWSEHFSKFLDGPSVQDVPDIEPGENLEVNRDSITDDDNQSAICKNNRGIAPGLCKPFYI